MMEENNRKGPGIFYAVVGVATLVVAIIGATFAYFSAATAAKGDAIKGGTLDVQGGVLSAEVTRVNFENPGTTSDKLVPAYFDKTGDALNLAKPADLTAENVELMLKNKCANGGYTGCHVWKITASTTQEVADADILLTLSTNGKNADQWGYAVFTADGNEVKTNGTDTDATLVTKDAIKTAGVAGLDIHNKGLTTALTADNANITSATDNKGTTEDTTDDVTTLTATYFLMVYINDTDVEQNAGDTTNDVTGNYEGSISFQAAGGKVRATFTA